MINSQVIQNDAVMVAAHFIHSSENMIPELLEKYRSFVDLAKNFHSIPTLSKKGKLLQAEAEMRYVKAVYTVLEQRAELLVQTIKLLNEKNVEAHLFSEELELVIASIQGLADFFPKLEGRIANFKENAVRKPREKKTA